MLYPRSQIIYLLYLILKTFEFINSKIEKKKKIFDQGEREGNRKRKQKSHRGREAGIGEWGTENDSLSGVFIVLNLDWLNVVINPRGADLGIPSKKRTFVVSQ